MYVCMCTCIVCLYSILVYDIIGSTSDWNVVVLNNIHIDIMDYIIVECPDYSILINM